MVESRYDIRVIYADTDMMGVVYYAKYLEYFEAARAHMLRELGIPYSEVEKQGYLLPVVECHCKYFSGATFEDIITVVIKIREIPKAKVKIEYELFKNSEQMKIANGYTIHSFIKKSGKPVRVPGFFLERIHNSWSD